MPKTTIEIREFGGIPGATDAHDVNPGMAFFIKNVDPTTRRGALVGMAKDTTLSGDSAATGALSRPFGGSGNFITVDVAGSTSVKAFSNNGSTVALLTSGTKTGTGSVRGIAGDNDTARVGLGGDASSPPMFVGYLSRRHKWTSPASDFGWIIESPILDPTCVGLPDMTSGGGFPDIELELPDKSLDDGHVTWDEASVRIPLGRLTYWASLVYDYSQETTLQPLLRLDIARGNIWIYYGNHTTTTKLDGGRAWLAGDPEEMYDDSPAESHPVTITGSFNASFPITESQAFALATGALPQVVSDADNPGPGTRTYLNASSYGAPEGFASLSFNIRIITGIYGGGTITHGSAIAKRVTGMKIYRQHAPLVDGVFDVNAVSDPLLCGTIDLTNASATSFTGLAYGNGSPTAPYNETDVAYQWFRFTDNGVADLLTYESESGLSNALPHMTVHYGLCANASGRMVIGQPYVKDLSNISSWLFVSRPGRPDVFDWATDYVVLQHTPIALEQFGGRAFAFSAATTSVVDPVGLETVETWNGIGCISQNTVVSTERGLFWADSNNIYLYDGNRLNTIGGPVLHVHDPGNTSKLDLGWLQRNTSEAATMLYVPVLNAILLCYSVGTGTPVAVGLLFNLGSMTWTLVDSFGGNTGGVVHGHTGPSGIPMAFVGSPTASLVSLFTQTAGAATGNRRPWKYVSGQLLDPARITKVYDGYISRIVLPSDVDAGFDATEQAAETLTVKYYHDDPSYVDTAKTPVTETADLHSGSSKLTRVQFRESSGADWGAFRDFAVELSSADGDVCVGGMSISVRPISQR